MALYRSGTPAHSVVRGSHDGSGRPSDTSYPTVTTGRTVLQHYIALLRSRLSVSDTAQLTRQEQENISTATDYKNDCNAPSNTGYQFATTLRNILLATSAVHTATRSTQLVTVSVSHCELNVSTSYIRRKARARCTRRHTELSVGGIRVSVNKQQTDWRVGRSVDRCWSRKRLESHAVDRNNSKRSYRTTEN